MTLAAPPREAAHGVTGVGAVIGPSPVPAAASTRLARLLSGPPSRSVVVHRGRDAVYLEVGGWCLGAVASTASQVPCALTVSAATQFENVSGAVVGNDVVVLERDDEAPTVIEVVRLVDRTVPPLNRAGATRPSAYDVAAMVSKCGAALAELGHTLDELTGLVVCSPGLLIGRGSGLTPLGDDVLAGWMATSYALGARVPAPDARSRTTLLSATLLDCAARGEVLPEFRELVKALHIGDPATVARSATALVRVGHTSGAGLLLGLCLRLRAGLDVRRQSALLDQRPDGRAASAASDVETPHQRPGDRAPQPHAGLDVRRQSALLDQHAGGER